MELKLNIYDNGEIIKTYTADKSFILTRTIDDLVKTINIDDLFDPKKDSGIISQDLIRYVLKDVCSIKPFFKDIFKDFQDEDFEKTSISEVLKCVMQIISYAIAEFSQAGDDSKN